MKKYILGAVFSIALLASPAFTQAASLTQNQINAIVSLLQSFGADSSTITNVQASLTGGTTTGGGTQPWCHTFNIDLTFGSIGTEVSALNRALYFSSIDIADYTGTFSEDTAASVVKFQAKYGIRQTGYVGPRTRAKLNALYGCPPNFPPPFPPLPLPSITVLSPNGGETWVAGSTHDVTWEIFDPVQGGSIYLSDSNGNETPIISSSVSNLGNGVFSNPWQIPNNLSPGNYLVVARAYNNLPYSDTSDARFSIVAAPPVSTPVTISSITPSSGPVGTSVRLDGCGSDSTSGFTLVYSGPMSGTASIPVETLGAASGCGYMTFAVPTYFPVGTYTLSVKNNQTGETSTNTKTFTVTTSSDSGTTVGTGSAVACTASFSPNPVKTGDITTLNFQSGTNDTLFQYSCNHQFTKEDGTTMLSYGTLPLGGSWRIKAPGPLDCTLTSWNPNVTGSGSTCRAILKTISETTTTTVTGPVGACTASFSPNPVKTGDITTLNFQSGTNDTLFQYSCNHQFTKEDGTTMLSYGTLPLGGSWRIKAPGPLDCTLTSWNPNVTGSGSTCRAILKTTLATNTYSNSGLASALGAFDGASETLPSTSGFSYTWNRDLQIGSPYQGDIIALQQALTREGVYAGEITGGFYNQTYAAVQDFQRKHGIDATGYVGQLTRSKLNILFAQR